MNKVHYIVVTNHDMGGSGAFDHLSNIILRNASDYLALEKEVRELFSKRKDAAGFKNCSLTIMPAPKEFQTTGGLGVYPGLNFILPEKKEAAETA
ncbi:MAG: hypothetical protein KBC44_01255 [Candidatus Pacebacteria bacterium]|nr:hypothetical protein [Candidatus Paceibacterota bacterium]